MQFEIEPLTERGRTFSAIAEGCAADFATRAAEHDREGSYPFENIAALQQENYFSAPIPVQFGGLGVDSVHDLVLGASRLARGDAALAIGVNMHLVGASLMARSLRVAQATGDAARAEAVGTTLQNLAGSGMVIAVTISEPGQDLGRPKTFAERTEGGWIINGRKFFCTMAPAATHLNVGLTFVGEDGQERYGYALLPVDTPGIVIHDDWDALGMRSSGSVSVSYENVRVPREAVRDAGFPAGEITAPMLDRYLNSGLFHASSSVGIAETAHDHIVQRLSGGEVGGASAARQLPMTQMLAAENAIELAALRATFSRAGQLIDRYQADHPDGSTSLDEAGEVFAQVQAAKVFTSSAAQRIVDRAMTMSGGSGYMNSNLLSRLYRDVRAAAFMHPLGTAAAYPFIGRVTTGLAPSF